MSNLGPNKDDLGLRAAAASIIPSLVLFTGGEVLGYEEEGDVVRHDGQHINNVHPVLETI